MLFLFRLLLPCLALVNPTNASVHCYTVVEIEALWKKKNRSDLELNWTTDLLTDKVKWQSHCHQLENTKYTTLNQITIKTTLQHKVDQNITPARIAKLVTRVEITTTTRHDIDTQYYGEHFAATATIERRRRAALRGTALITNAMKFEYLKSNKKLVFCCILFILCCLYVFLLSLCFFFATIVMNWILVEGSEL